MSEKVLLVDDDVNLLEGIRRQLRKSFNLECAEGGEKGVELLRTSGPFAVIVSDMQMPKMNGITLLEEANRLSPDTVRIMLTGNADQQTAVDAVNSGKIFRFLNKPCSREDLSSALKDAVEHHRLITAEKILVSKTLTGSVKVLTDVLAMANPRAFQKAAQIRRLFQQLITKVEVDQAWECQIAAMLCQLGFVTIPDDVLDKVIRGDVLSDQEKETFRRHPKTASGLIKNIPRLAGVARIVEYQSKHFDGSGFPEDSVAENEIPMGSRVLKVASDFLEILAYGETAERAFDRMIERTGWYDPSVLEALKSIVEVEPDYGVVEVAFDELEEGDVLAEDIVTNEGTILVSHGAEVNESMLAKLKQFKDRKDLKEPISVVFTGVPDNTADKVEACSA